MKYSYTKLISEQIFQRNCVFWTAIMPVVGSLCRRRNCDCSHHPLMYCMFQGQNDEVKSHLQKIRNFRDLADESGRTLLHEAVGYWNDEMVEYLLRRGCDVDAQDTSGLSSLMLAINRGDKIVEILLRFGADVYASSHDGKSVFEQAFYCILSLSIPCGAASAGAGIVILQMIVDKVNDDFSKGKLYEWLLSVRDLVKLIIITFASSKLVKFVLRNGYPIDYSDKFTFGCTALHCAMLMAKLDNAKLLMEHGANVDALDNEGNPPLRYYTPNFDDKDDDSELLMSLLKSSKRLSAHDQCYSKSVENLLIKGKKSVVKTLLLSGIDVEPFVDNNNSNNLLMCLMRNENKGILDLIDELDMKFDVNRRTNDGMTALIYAARIRSWRKVEFLLRNGADVNMQDGDGKTALMYMRISPMSNDYQEDDADVAKVVEVLLQYGAEGVQSSLNYHQHKTVYFCSATRVAVAHLALLAAQDQSSLTDKTRNVIESKRRLKSHFDLCTKQISQMKDIKVHGTVTWFKLLTDEDEKLVFYARNDELIASFKSLIKNLSHLEPYYLNIAKRRLSRGLNLAKLQKKVAMVIEALTGISANVYHEIVYRIINYLDRRDWKNLCKIYS